MPFTPRSLKVAEWKHWHVKTLFWVTLNWLPWGFNLALLVPPSLKSGYPNGLPSLRKVRVLGGTLGRDPPGPYSVSRRKRHNLKEFNSLGIVSKPDSQDSFLLSPETGKCRFRNQENELAITNHLPVVCGRVLPPNPAPFLWPLYQPLVFACWRRALPPNLTQPEGQSPGPRPGQTEAGADVTRTARSTCDQHRWYLEMSLHLRLLSLPSRKWALLFGLLVASSPPH